MSIKQIAPGLIFLFGFFDSAADAKVYYGNRCKHIEAGFGSQGNRYSACTIIRCTGIDAVRYAFVCNAGITCDDESDWDGSRTSGLPLCPGEYETPSGVILPEGRKLQTYGE